MCVYVCVRVQNKYYNKYLVQQHQQCLAAVGLRFRMLNVINGLLFSRKSFNTGN